MLRNAMFHRAIANFFLLALISPLAFPGLNWAMPGSVQLMYAMPKNKINFLQLLSSYGGINTVACWWQPAQSNDKQCQFTLALAVDGQEIENQYINNTPIYTRTLQYLNGDIAHDVYLHLVGQPDSVMASSATYIRQYGMTGHSSVIVTFPVPEKHLRRGCRLSFRSVQLGLPARQFVFSARSFKLGHQ